MIARLGDYALAEVLQRVGVWDRARAAGTNRQFARVYAHMFRARDRKAALVLYRCMCRRFLPIPVVGAPRRIGDFRHCSNLSVRPRFTKLRGNAVALQTLCMHWDDLRPLSRFPVVHTMHIDNDSPLTYDKQRGFCKRLHNIPCTAAGDLITHVHVRLAHNPKRVSIRSVEFVHSYNVNSANQQFFYAVKERHCDTTRFHDECILLVQSPVNFLYKPQLDLYVYFGDCHAPGLRVHVFLRGLVLPQPLWGQCQNYGMVSPTTPAFTT